MLPFFGPRFGNPSSVHRWGREARTALDEARERVARCLGALARRDRASPPAAPKPTTSPSSAPGARGATKGATRVVTTPIEHKAVLAAVHQAAREGAEERICRDDGATASSTRASYDALVRRHVAIASVMWVNNEIGTDSADRRAGAAARRARGALFHTDAVQAFGKVAIDATQHAVRRSLDLRPQDRRAQGHRRGVHPPRHGRSSRCSTAARRIAAVAPERRTSRR